MVVVLRGKRNASSAIISIVCACVRCRSLYDLYDGQCFIVSKQWLLLQGTFCPLLLPPPPPCPLACLLACLLAHSNKSRPKNSAHFSCTLLTPRCLCHPVSGLFKPLPQIVKTWFFCEWPMYQGAPNPRSNHAAATETSPFVATS